MNGPVGEHVSRLPGCLMICSQRLSLLTFLAMNLPMRRGSPYGSGSLQPFMAMNLPMRCGSPYGRVTLLPRFIEVGSRELKTG
jgi:hypothetical protein